MQVHSSKGAVVADVRQPAWIHLEGANNARDVGGLPADGGQTASGVLFRTDALDALTAGDVLHLVHDLGLRHVVDLRTPSERAERGRGALGETSVTYSEVAVFDDADLDRRRTARLAAMAEGRDGPLILADGYVELLELGREVFATVLRRLVEPGGTPALVHCAAGKDRTGVLIALLLDAAAVDREAIVADYVATRERLDRIVSRLDTAASYQDVTRDMPAFVLDAHADTMTAFLAELERGWGGGRAWFAAAGVDDDVLDAWTALIVVP
jgi:hypothetical protein